MHLLLRLPLQLYEHLIRHPKAAHEYYQLSIQVSLTVCGASDDVEGEVVRGEFDLALAQADVISASGLLVDQVIIRFHSHEHSFRPADSDLKGAARQIAEAVGDIGCETW